jgi:spore photoproduct lyase
LLLLVTKGGVRDCKPLFETSSCANVVVSFSVNAPDAARRHEAGAATVEDRLEAARRLKKAGWRVRMRIDPMIAGFDYAGVIAAIRELGPERVTLGSLRAESSLLRAVNHGMFEGLEKPGDRKALARYRREERLALYREAVEGLRDICGVALCEETEDIWKDLGLDYEAKECNCAL